MVASVVDVEELVGEVVLEVPEDGVVPVVPLVVGVEVPVVAPEVGVVVPEAVPRPRFVVVCWLVCELCMSMFW